MTQEFVTLPREVVEQALEAMSLALSDVDWRKDSPTQPVIHKAYNATSAALEQPQIQSGGIPPNWKLVPVEPTIRMRLSARAWTDAPTSVYHAMLAAAPQPPTTKDSSVVQPQANQPAMTPIAQRKLEDLMASGYTISGYSIYHEQKHQHGFVTGSGLVGWWKPDGMEYPHPQGEQEPVAVASMPFCRLEWLIGETVTAEQVFEMSRQGVKLYTCPQPKRDPLPDHYINGMFSAASIAEGDMFRRFARAIEAAHNIK